MSSPKLSPPQGAKKSRKRLGRGPGSGTGKTSGRGHKGQGARSGSKKRAWFEGGQMPLVRRVPKRGFTPHRRTVYQIVNLSSLAEVDSGQTLSPAEMAAQGCIHDADGLVKVLGDGELSQPVHLHAHKFSKTALEKIEKAGGTATVIPLHSPSGKMESATSSAGDEK